MVDVFNNGALIGNWFDDISFTIVACSGGIDSLLLAHLASTRVGERLRVVHAVSPAVPPEATARVVEQAQRYGWVLQLIETGEFSDDRYLANPVDRCFHCKSHLYGMLDHIAQQTDSDSCVVSGANKDDLGEYRPGLLAASQHNVRHPYIELGLGKLAIREMARHLGLNYSDLPASPCLASRLYTGTRVTPERVRFVNRAEQLVREMTGCVVVRCRIDGIMVKIEVPDGDRHRIDRTVSSAVFDLAGTHLPEIGSVILDARPYAPGRAFVGAK